MSSNWRVADPIDASVGRGTDRGEGERLVAGGADELAHADQPAGLIMHSPLQ